MRRVAGCLLVCAAVLKTLEFVTEPAAALVHPLGPYFLTVNISIELVVGLLILAGLCWQTLRRLVLMLFTGFASYSLYLALNGAASCGCFGSLRVNPWWTFGLDSVVVLGPAVIGIA